MLVRLQLGLQLQDYSFDMVQSLTSKKDAC